MSLKRFGLALYLVGLGYTFISPNYYGLAMWFTGLVIYFVATAEDQKRQAREVQESQ